VPLYLEWAPQDIFSTPASSKEQQQQAKRAGQPAAAATGGAGAGAAADGQAGAAAAMEGVQAGSAGGEDEGDEADVSTLYVKNLAFATTDAGLRKHFDKVG